MKKVKQYGFFRELEHGISESDSIKDFIDKINLKDKDKIVNYLASGHLFIACPGVVADILSESSEIIGCPNILTDGEWAWPEDLVYYVSKYNVDIPELMKTFIVNNNWKVPEKIDITNLQL